MKVAVIGSSGAMGSYFTKYFLEQGRDVITFDVRRRPPGGARAARSATEAASGSDFIVVAVPLEDTVEAVRAMAPALRKGSTLVEITSVKAERLTAVRTTLRGRGVSLLSIHPLFGPSNGSRRPKICVLGGQRGLRAARSLFPDAELLPMSRREHDRLMAYELSLVHLANLALVSSVAKGAGLSPFRRAATPISGSQLDLSMAILSQDPGLYARLAVENPETMAALSSYIEELQSLKEAISRKDLDGFEGLFASLARMFDRKELKRALDSVYGARGA